MNTKYFRDEQPTPTGPHRVGSLTLIGPLRRNLAYTGPHSQRAASAIFGGHFRDFRDFQVQKFINLCMKHGKKSKSYKIISNTFRRLSLSEGPLALALLMNAVENIKPRVEVRSVRISGTTQLVPSIIPQKRQISLAIRWIVEASIKRRKKSMTLDQCFFAELMDASRGLGAAKKRRDDLHKLAEANRGFAHYRWW
jgi:small subunit ribosomal protein S7